VGADDGNPAPEHAQGLGLSAKRARKAHQVLSQILASAVGGGRLPRNVAEGIKLPKVQRREMYFLTAAQEVAGHLEWGGVKTHEACTVRLPRSLAEELGAYLAGRLNGREDLVFTAPCGGPLRESKFVPE
jgi:hypothetical protein